VLVRASLGIALGSRGQSTADDLLRNADVAMYVAKSNGKGRFEMYEQAMHASMVDRLELLGDLQRAIEHSEFKLLYQPTVHLRTGQIVGVEALVRWLHPRRGLLSPAQFIPLAEESGVILHLGRWVLQTACEQAAEWRKRFAADPPLAISVNVSVRQIQQQEFVQEVAAALSSSGLQPDALILEVTESVMMQDARATVGVLSQLKALGVRLAIDDFGTGYSSLSYLSQFPFDILKIDRSFIRGEPNSGQQELTRAIIDLGKNLQLQTVAEGIERSEQLTRLRSMDCELGQGFLFAEPLETEAVERLLAGDGITTEEAA
jgi:EAL domain-containing protein (putative c-di-GMP-specific phosphodiesterase class I)